MSNYRTMYTKLAVLINYEFKIPVFDFSHFGYLVAPKNLKKKGSISTFIVIKSSLSWKDKYYTLLHELGHAYYINAKGALMPAKRVRNEDQANEFALSLCTTPKEQEAFKTLYEKAGRVRRIESWRDIIEKWTEDEDIPEIEDIQKTKKGNKKKK